MPKFLQFAATALSCQVICLWQFPLGAAAALASQTFESSPSSSALSKNRECVVVGGGPIGLATALTLSRPPHSFAVTVLEKSVGETSVTAYDPSRSYLYNVNPRGLQWFDDATAAPDSARQKLAERGHAPIGGMGPIVIVPADPDTAIAEPKEVQLAGKIQLANRTNYWIPRHQMVQLLLECCQDQNRQAATFRDGGGRIKVCSGKQVDSVVPDDNDILNVHCQDGTTYSGALVVAADGIDSAVRSCLAGGDSSGGSRNGTSARDPPRTWLQSAARSFRVKKYNSPSVGIKLKALQLPPNFTLPNGKDNESRFTSRSTDIISIRSVNTGPRNSCSLGLLPMKDPNSVRPANTNTLSDHEIWNLSSGAEARAWFRKSFPRIPWDDLVDDAEWKRYVTAKGTVFPPCQYSKGSAVSSADGLSGVVMVGDACHAFPPDIGQGINAGLQDVLALDRALQGKRIVASGTSLLLPARRPRQRSLSRTIGSALAVYQTNRGPEHRALIRLARCGAPYQYRQAWWRHRIGAVVWTANVALRMVLHTRLSLGWPAAIVLVSRQHDLSFRQVMRRADGTTAGLCLVVAVGLFLRWCGGGARL